MKKLLCVALALLLCAVMAFTGCSLGGGEKEKSGGSVVDNGEIPSIATGLGFRSDLEIQSEAVKIESEQPIGSQAQAFLDGVFYFEGTVFTMDNEGMEMKMATDANKNLQLETTLEDITITFLILEKQPYLINKKDNTYIEVNSRLLSILGIDTDSLTEISNFTSNTNASMDDDTTVTQTAVLINGEEGLCTEIGYKTDDGKDNSVKLYTIGEKLCQAENFDEKDNMTMQMAFTTFSPTIPSDQLTLAGYTKATYYSFIQSLVG